MRKLAGVLIALILCAGVAQARWKPNTPSGMPEIVINKCSETDLRPVAINILADAGIMLESSQPNLLVFQHPKPNFMGYYSKAQMMVTDGHGDCRVIIRQYAVNPNANSLNQGQQWFTIPQEVANTGKRPFEEGMSFLQTLKLAFESKYPERFNGESPIYNDPPTLSLTTPQDDAPTLRPTTAQEGTP